MKKLMLALLLLSGCSFNSKSVDIAGEQIEKDLQTKWVVISPQGQLWGFAKDQKIDVSVLEIRTVMEKNKPIAMVVYIELKAVANIPPHELPKEQKTTTNKAPAPPTPTAVELVGIAKLSYEIINNQKILSNVEGVSLTVRPH